MVDITVLPNGGHLDRMIAIDFGPPAGPYIALTWAEWCQLRQWMMRNDVQP